MKKLLAISLAVIMLFALAAPVMAVDTKPFMIGETGYDTLKAAIDAAQAGDTITMTKDQVETNVASITISKNITINGGGFDLEIRTTKYGQGANDNVFAFIINSGATVNVTNFKEISSSGGGFNVTSGTLNVSDVDSAYTLGRVVIKTTAGGTNTAVVNVEDSTLKSDTTTGKAETVLLIDGDGTNTFNLKNGANIVKNNPSNGAANGAAAVIYVNKAGTHTINMEAGSKMVSNCAEGNATGSIIGNQNTKTLTVNIASGAYLVLDSAKITTFNFIHNVGTKTLKLTAPDGAFLVKNGLTPTINDYQGGINDNATQYQFVALDTSPVAGYTAYKMNPLIVENFEYVAADGTTQKTGLLSTAIANAKEGTTVKLLKDLTISETGVVVNKAVTFDLNGKTLINTGKAYAFSSVTKALTVKNGTMNFAGGFVVQNGGVLTLDGVTLNAQISGDYVRPMIKLSGTAGTVSSGKISDAKSTTTAAVIKDSTVTSWNAKDEALILIEHATDGTLDIIGNSVVKYQGPTGGGNNAAIFVQQSWTGDNSLSADARTEYNNRASSNTDAVINIGAGATVVCGSVTHAETKIAMIIKDGTNGNITVNLEKDAIAKFDRDPGASTSQFITNDNKGTVTVNDKGASYVISPEVAKVGAVLPVNLLGYKLGETILSSNTFIDAAATTEITLKAVEIDYSMIKGAAVRTTLPFGLRFSATLSKDIYDAILAKDPNAKFGFAFRRDITGDAEFGDDYEMMDAGKVVVGEDGNVIVYKTLTIDANGKLLTAENKTNFRRAIAARAYIKLTVDGEEVIYWTDYNVDENSRSIYNVAKAYYEDTVNGSTENKVINYILEECGYKF